MCAGYIYIYEGVRNRKGKECREEGRKVEGEVGRGRRGGASQPAVGRPSTQETYS